MINEPVKDGAFNLIIVSCFCAVPRYWGAMMRSVENHLTESDSGLLGALGSGSVAFDELPNILST